MQMASTQSSQDVQRCRKCTSASYRFWVIEIVTSVDLSFRPPWSVLRIVIAVDDKDAQVADLQAMY
jgi:hypothetical protein